MVDKSIVESASKEKYFATPLTPTGNFHHSPRSITIANCVSWLAARSLDALESDRIRILQWGDQVHPVTDDHSEALQNPTLKMNALLRLTLLISIMVFCLMAINPLPLLAQGPAPDFGAETVTDSYGIHLSWSENTAFDHVEIQRSANGVSAWETWAESPGNQYVDTLVACSHTYFYRARTVDAAGVTTPWSSVVNATVAPCAPIAVSVYPVPGWYILRVTWVDIAPAETNFRLERSPDGATWREFAELPPSAGSYTDRFRTDQCSTSLFYRLRTERDGIFSPYTAVHSNTVSPCSPSALWVELTHNDEHVRVHWRDNAPDETGFEVWRRSDVNPTSQLIATIPAAEAVGAAVAWEDDTPDCQALNYYQLRAIRGMNSASPWEPHFPDQLLIYVPNCSEPAPTPTELSVNPPITISKPSPIDVRLDPSLPPVIEK